MYLDKLLMLSEDQAITATAASANVIDLGASGDLGKSGRTEVYVRVSEAFNNLTSLNIKLQTDDAVGFGTAVDLPAQETTALAGLTLNKELLKAVVPYGCKRYLRLYYTVTGTAPTAGKVFAGLINTRQTNP